MKYYLIIVVIAFHGVHVAAMQQFVKVMSNVKYARTLYKKSENLAGVCCFRDHRRAYKDLRSQLLYYLHPDRQDKHRMNAIIDICICASNEGSKEYATLLLGTALSRMTPEQFAAVVRLNTEHSLWEKSYPWSGMVFDMLVASMKAFTEKELWILFGILVRACPQHNGLFRWSCKNLPRAYETIGYDGLKKLYEAADPCEKPAMLNAYTKMQKEMIVAKKRLYFLDEIINYHYHT